MRIGTSYYLFTALLFSLPGGYAFGAGIYKWVDTDGTVQYGEQPPPQGAKEIHLRSTGGAEQQSEAAPARQNTDPRLQRDKMIQALEGDRRARQEKKQQQQKDQQTLKMQCAQAKDTLRQYKEAVGLYKLDSQGNRQTIPESARQQETRRLEAEIKKRCK